MTSMVEALQVGIGGRLKPTDLTISGGEMIAVIGPNGGGKTSLLRALARTEDALGAVTIDGQDLDQTRETQRRCLLAFLPATREAAWPVSVSDYLKFGLGTPDAARLGELLLLLELAPIAARPIDRLSTGERARAMLGRAIASRPRLLLLDEPLSNLDPYWVLRTVEIVRAEIEANDSAGLVSVHDLETARQFDRLLLVSDGTLLADGSPGEVLGSALFLKAFRVTRAGRGWAITPQADPRSSP